MLVSVIIPCYNVEEYITECLESVYAQTYKNIEVICVDNNSSDNTIDKLRQLKLRYPDLIIESEKRGGANNARNKGLDIANGEWIQFLDADDLLKINKIEHQFKLIKKTGKETDFIAAAYFRKPITGNSKIVSYHASDYYISAFINQCGITSSNLWKKESLIDVGKWNGILRSSQEADLMLRLVLCQKKYIVDTEPLTIIRERESGQISQGDPVKKWKQYLDIRLSYLETLKHKHPSEYSLYKPAFFDFLMISVITLAKYDKSSAISYYNLYIKSEWKTSCQYGFTKFKYILIKLLGFRFSVFFFNK